MEKYELMKGFIYKITSPNGKIYIGQTINIKQRKGKYKANGFKGQIKLWLNCNKHNWNPVDSFEIIEECLCGKNRETLNEREKFWIIFYDSFKSGLNCNEGGNGNLGKKVSEETKKKNSLRTKEQWASMTDEQKKTRSEKISAFGKTRTNSIETREKIKKSKKDNPFKPDENFRRKISESLIGKPGRNTGNTHSDNAKQKISDTKKGVENKKLAKKVLCLTNNKVYDSIIKAAIELGVNQSKISMVCKGNRLTTGGYKFKYYEEEISNF